MKILKRILMIVLLTMSSLGSPVHSNNTDIATNLIVTSDVQLPQAKYLGLVTLNNGVQLPAYSAYYVAGWSDKDYETTQPDSLNIEVSLSKNLQNELVLYHIANKWFLVPKEWQLTTAIEGVNGSQYISFSPPENNQSGLEQQSHFLFESAGACYGCGLHLASPFFQQADLLNQQDFSAEKKYCAELQTINIRPHTKAWRYTLKGQNIDGLAYWNIDGAINIAENVQISLPSSQQHLATPVLNWWLKN